MIFKSIKWRLQAWHGLLLVLLVAGFIGGFYNYERRARLRAVDGELYSLATPLLPEVTRPIFGEEGDRGRPLPPRDRERLPPEPFGEERLDRPGGPPERSQRPRGNRSVLNQFESGKFYYVAWTQEGTIVSRSATAPAEVPEPRADERKGGEWLRTRGEWRELIHTTPRGDSVLVGTSLAQTVAGVHKLGIQLTLIGCGIIVVGLGVGWWTVTRALRPIAAISRAAQEIAAGDLSKRINTDETESELGRLATVLNSTFARLEAAFAQQKQFTSDASHELRTPVSVILTQTQSTLARERSVAEYRETIESCQRAAQRMRRLIESLLELARIDAGQEKMKHLRFDLANTARECVELVQPLAETRRIRIHSDFAAAECEGDSERMAQVVTNLLTNAINYNHEGGEVRISTCNGHGAAVVTIADNGPGISGEHLPRIFERFYRADAARTTTQGRSGLGLAICKAIVDAHGGSIEVSSQPGAGAKFTVSLPALQGKRG